MNADRKLTRQEIVAAPASTLFSGKPVGMAIVAVGPAFFWTGLLDALGPWLGLCFTSIVLGLVGLAIAVFVTLVFAAVTRSD